MFEVVVGVVLTAALGGLLVPYVKGVLDRKTERFNASTALVDTLAAALWGYWKAALRVAYYGRQGERGAQDLDDALRRWDGDDSWEAGTQTQIQVSRSKRLLPPLAQEKLDRAQQDVVDFLDQEIDRLRIAASADDWNVLHHSLMTAKRQAIDAILNGVIADLRITR